MLRLCLQNLLKSGTPCLFCRHHYISAVIIRVHRPIYTENYVPPVQIAFNLPRLQEVAGEGPRGAID